MSDFVATCDGDISNRRIAIETATLATVIGADLSDVPLLMSLAGVHSPQIVQELLCEET